MTEYYSLAILLMTLLTFYMRYAFFSRLLPIKIPPKVKTLLLFTAPCVLAAMIIPIMFKDTLATHSFAQSIHSAYFWASLATIIFSLVIRNTLVVIGLSMAVFYGLRYFIF
ncbi:MULTISPECIES: AzlD domain-containing protein [unclassified Acinetobacter]|uniref:AzlD domain-containing protein n=1 Tax=unclassified Acinetobacter TaxID=196816 RepID=UPI0035B74805